MTALGKAMDQAANQRSLDAERKRVVALAKEKLDAGVKLAEVAEFLDVANVELASVAINYELRYDGLSTP